MTASPFDVQPLFLGRQAEELSNLIEAQIQPIFEEIGIRIPIRSCSVATALKHLGTASAADIANHLGQSHQLVIQKLPALVRLAYLDEQADPHDRRRKLLKLTHSGKRQVLLLEKHAVAIERAYEDLNSELGVNLYHALVTAVEALHNKPLSKRITLK